MFKQKEAIEVACKKCELELARLGQEHHTTSQTPNIERTSLKTPKCPSFVNGKEDVDVYLQQLSNSQPQQS